MILMLAMEAAACLIRVVVKLCLESIAVNHNTPLVFLITYPESRQTVNFINI